MVFGNKFIKYITVMTLILMFSMMMGCLDNSEQESKLLSTQTDTTTDVSKGDQVDQVVTVGAQKDFKVAYEGKSLIFETLISVDRYGNPVPELVESWDVSEDGKIYTLHLKKGVVFHGTIP